MKHKVLTLALFATAAMPLISSTTAVAQSVPPGTGRYGISSSQAKAQSKAVAAPPVTALPAPLIAAAAVGKVTASTLSPFTATVNAASAPQTLTFKNTSATDTFTLALNTVAGTNFADFRVSPCESQTLKPGYTCDFIIVYQPAAATTSSATLSFTATDVTVAGSQNLSIPVSGAANASCAQPTSTFLPLSHKDVANATINCYFNATSNFAFATAAQYLYNPGASANTISGDLASLQFPGGFQLTLAGNASTGSCANSNTGSESTGATATTTSNSSCGTSTSGTSAPSLQQDEQTLTQGGTFALKGLWPVVNLREPGIQIVSMLVPKMGFDISGLSAQGTATGATNVNGNLSSETYFQLDAIPASAGSDSLGSLFADYRVGWEHVSSAFASSAGLTGGDNFALQQFSAGLVVNGFLRISAQRYFGPEQAYINASGSTVTVNNFKNWQLAIQLVPSNVKTKN